MGVNFTHVHITKVIITHVIYGGNFSKNFFPEFLIYTLYWGLSPLFDLSICHIWRGDTGRGGVSPTYRGIQGEISPYGYS